MNIYHKIFLLLFFLPFLTSCEDVIVLDLEESAQRFVIEANLNATDSSCVVKISKSGGFYQTNNFEKIENATLLLNLSNGNSYNFSESSAGEYRVDSIAIAAGDSAYLSVSLTSGELFNAATYCPTPISLDTLEVRENVFQGQTFYQLLYTFQDPAAEENFYRLKVRQNDTLLDGYIVYDDAGQDGQEVTLPYFGPPFDPADTLDVTLMSIDQTYHDYYLQVSDVQSQGLGASIPYNPKGNFGKEVLGYFGIYHENTMRIIVPQ
jgi:hypothetical protein